MGKMYLPGEYKLMASAAGKSCTLRLSPLFADHAILQRNEPIPVWGWSSPGALIRVTFNGKSVFTGAGDSGKFIAYLEPCAGPGPYEMQVDDGTETITLHDLLVGDVYLCGGQSNMVYTLGTNWAAGGEYQLGAVQLEEFLQSVRNGEAPSIRFITVEKAAPGTRQETFSGEWKLPEESAFPSLSAVAAWFALFLRKKVSVPIGLVVSAWGGTRIRSWISREGLLSNPATKEMVFRNDALSGSKEVWLPDENGVYTPHKTPPGEPFADPGNIGVDRGWAAMDFDDRSWKAFTVPGSWMAEGVAGNGTVWVRREVMLPADWEGRELILSLGGIDKADICYFNGVEIGRTGKEFEAEHYDTPRHYTVQPSLVRAGRNVIAIRAFSFSGDGAFRGRGTEYQLQRDPASVIVLGGSWKIAVEQDFGRIADPFFYGPGQSNAPGILFDGMIHPLIPFGFKGILFYQGESDSDSSSPDYKSCLHTLFSDWRYRFGKPDLPVFIIQLASFMKKTVFDWSSGWAQTRFHQWQYCKEDPHAYPVPAVDLGCVNDCHPQNKKDVGSRLARSVLHHLYGYKDIAPSGPDPLSCTRKGNSLCVDFRYGENLFLTAGGEKSFFLAGPDGVYYPADLVTVEKNRILVSSGAVPEPEKICYAWSSTPECTLSNGTEDTPCFPFYLEAGAE